jgi:hypothetical protein
MYGNVPIYCTQFASSDLKYCQAWLRIHIQKHIEHIRTPKASNVNSTTYITCLEEGSQRKTRDDPLCRQQLSPLLDGRDGANPLWAAHLPEARNHVLCAWMT